MNILESTHVKDIYDNIAESFNITRENRIWSNVQLFIEQNILDHDNKKNILDYGCGNGKYIPLINLNKHSYHAFDNCQKFIDLINKKYPKVITKKGDVCCENNYPPESFDLIICIAVIHHLTTFERRCQLIIQIINMIKVGGKCLITAWTNDDFLEKSQSKNKIFKKSKKINDDNDFLIPFLHDNVNYDRFYHLFRYNDFLDIIEYLKKDITSEYLKKDITSEYLKKDITSEYLKKDISYKINIEDYYYHENNYYLIISKI